MDSALQQSQHPAIQRPAAVGEPISSPKGLLPSNSCLPNKFECWIQECCWVGYITDCCYMYLLQCCVTTIAGGQGEKDGDGEGDQPKPKKARAVKEYVPKVGSANYAFLVVMYMVSGSTHTYNDQGGPAPPVPPICLRILQVGWPGPIELLPQLYL
eukprot:145219-Pelagomonas_calceolata.AAC.5